MSVPQIKATQLSNAGPSAPVMIAGPSLGTSGTALWASTAALLDGFTVIAWDLPGHGNSPAATDGFSIGELAAAVHQLVEDAAAAGDISRQAQIHYAGVSLGGAVGLQLGLDFPTAFTSLAILCSGAKSATPKAGKRGLKPSGTKALRQYSFPLPSAGSPKDSSSGRKAHPRHCSIPCRTPTGSPTPSAARPWLPSTSAAGWRRSRSRSWPWPAPKMR